MKAPEAIDWLRAILDDELDPDDPRDAKRRQAVERAIESLVREIEAECGPRTEGNR